MYIPPGLAHGFCVLSDTVLFAYKCTDTYNAAAEGGIFWNDPDLGIVWPIREPILSPKDEKYPRLRDVPKDRLPIFGAGQ
jgi:dTDP-4-dehydrorhamnose 3,5-epimerase